MLPLQRLPSEVLPRASKLARAENLGLEAATHTGRLPVPGLRRLLEVADLPPQNTVRSPAMGLSGRTFSTFAV